MTTPTGPDLDTMKQVNRQFITGVTVVTTMDDEKPRGLAVNAFSSVSLDPPTVMVAVQRTSSTHDCLFRATHLAINILSTDQLDVVGVFATKADDKFAGLDWEPAQVTGSPVIKGTLAHLDCTIQTVHESGDHFVVIGRVLELVTDPSMDEAEADPLLFYRGKYRTTDAQD